MKVGMKTVFFLYEHDQLLLEVNEFDKIVGHDDQKCHAT